MPGAVVNLSRSPHAALRPVPLNAVTLHDAFWEPRCKINREVTLAAQWKQCEETGRIDNFRRASGKIQGEFQGIFFNDSDVYKWAEAASFSLATHPDAKLEADLDAVIAEIAAAQQPDGYLDTYFMFEREKDRYTNLKDMHEIYCGGHLIQAAVAHHRATGKTALLDVACRLADHWFALFGPGKRDAACGHPEAEMALVELCRETGSPDYLTLAKRMIDVRGQGERSVLSNEGYHQDHLPFVEQIEMTGHAVRHLYLCCGAADVLAETSDPLYLNALSHLHENFTYRKMYVTGGAGARWEGEAFGDDYELPNDRAYAETCAAIGSVMWNWRMLNVFGSSEFADLMEHTLYNAVLPGLSLDGTHYFYQNPLADNGKHRRQAWFGCACCPPNVARMLASLPGYFYSTTQKGVYVHLYAASSAALPMPDGGTVTIKQETDYPWDGEITLDVQNNSNAEFLYLRMPAWVQLDTVLLNGERMPLENWIPKGVRGEDFSGYLAVNIKDNPAQTLRLTLPMPIEILESRPEVFGNQGQIALQRGPLIYCIENADMENGVDVRRVVLSEENALQFVSEFKSDLLGGVTVLRGQGEVKEAQEMTGQVFREQPLYFPSRNRPYAARRISLTAIPYYAWANRAPGAMRVWIASR